MKEIQIGGERGKGLFALVDDEDFDFLNRYHWCVNGGGYAQRSDGSFMHKILCNAPKRKSVDHLNLIKLDNRKENLRVANARQQAHNRQKYKTRDGKAISSQYKGVSWNKRHEKWSCSIIIQGKRKFLGYSHDEVELAKKYDQYAKQYFGKFAHINFSNEKHG